MVLIFTILHHISYKKNFEDVTYQEVMELFKTVADAKDSKIKKFSTMKKKLDENSASRDLILLAGYMEKAQKRNGIPSNLLTPDEVVRLCKKRER